MRVVIRPRGQDHLTAEGPQCLTSSWNPVCLKAKSQWEVISLLIRCYKVSVKAVRFIVRSGICMRPREEGPLGKREEKRGEYSPIPCWEGSPPSTEHPTAVPWSLAWTGQQRGPKRSSDSHTGLFQARHWGQKTFETDLKGEDTVCRFLCPCPLSL